METPTLSGGTLTSPSVAALKARVAMRQDVTTLARDLADAERAKADAEQKLSAVETALATEREVGAGLAPRLEGFRTCPRPLLAVLFSR